MKRHEQMKKKHRELFAINSGAEHAAFIELLGDRKISLRWQRLVQKWQKRFGMERARDR